MSPKKTLAKKTIERLEDKIDSVLAAIQKSEHPENIVKSLPPHDFLMAFRQAEDEQKTELLLIADKHQVDLLLDLSCWAGDRPDMAKLDETLKPLIAIGIDGASRALDILEPELITLFLKLNAVVHLLENRNDVLEVNPASEVIPFPDGLYYLEFPDPDLVSETQRAMYQLLMYLPFETYQKELEAVRQELPFIMEESAYRWHNARLADYGFAPQEEARAILAPREVEDVRKMAEKTVKKSYQTEFEYALPVLYREGIRGDEFLTAVFARLKTHKDENDFGSKSDLSADLSGMIGTFLTAIGSDLADINAVARSVKAARNLLSLGLFETCRGDVDEGARFLDLLHPTNFIQVGLGLLYPLQKRARNTLKQKRFATSRRLGSIFDTPHYLTLTGLAKDIPCYFDQLFLKHSLSFDLIEPLPDELKVFSNREELASISVLLEEAEQVETLLFDHLCCEAPLPAETPVSVLLLTALANLSLGRSLISKPISPAEALEFDKKAKADLGGRFIDDALVALSSHLRVKEGPLMQLAARLTKIGHARLLADVPERALLLE